MRLLANNGRFLFEEGEKSKDKFCQLLHSQIDISNRLVMMLSQADERRFLEFSQQMNNSPRTSNPFFPGPSREEEQARAPPARPQPVAVDRESVPAELSRSNLNSSNSEENRNASFNFHNAEQPQKAAPSHYENIKSFLFDQQRSAEMNPKSFFNSEKDKGVPQSVGQLPKLLTTTDPGKKRGFSKSNDLQGSQK